MYQPAEDSFFFADFLKKYLSRFKTPGRAGKKITDISYCDMGTATGILSETAKSAGVEETNILAVDISPEAVKFVKSKGILAVKSNLFSKVRKKFDLITFNAPYLPASKYDKQKDTTGGKRGDETAVEFIKQARKHINKGGKIFLLISSITPRSNISKFKPRVVAGKNIFFEELLIMSV